MPNPEAINTLWLMLGAGGAVAALLLLRKYLHARITRQIEREAAIRRIQQDRLRIREASANIRTLATQESARRKTYAPTPRSPSPSTSYRPSSYATSSVSAYDSGGYSAWGSDSGGYSGGGSCSGGGGGDGGGGGCD